jgi:hypothetical protein
MQDRLEVAEGKLMRSAVKASLVADTGRPDSDEVSLRRCALAKLLSVLNIPDLDLNFLLQLRQHAPSTFFPTRTHTAEHTSRARDHLPSDTALPATTSVPRAPLPSALWNSNPPPGIREAPHKRHDLCRIVVN